METFHSLASQQAVIAWIFIIIGILALGFALFFLGIIRYALFKGLGLVFFITAICQIAFGCYLLYLSPHSYSPEPSSFTWVSLGITFTGMFLVRGSEGFWKGVGLGMAIQGLLSLVLLMMHAGELQRQKSNITQQTTQQTECRKKIDECRNWYGDFS